ncbi:MAG: hypothetical protein ACP5RT_01725 [Candidatus Micrarchaeia archaeon]
MIVPFGLYGFNIAVLLISIMLMIGGIILGLGYALDEKKLKDFGKNEIYQSIINGILVGGLLAMFMSNGIISLAIKSLIPENISFSCPTYMHSNLAICFAYNYLAGTTSYTIGGIQHISMLEEITMIMSGLFLLSTLLGSIASLEINLFVVTLNFSYIVKPFLNEIQYILGLLTATAVSLSVQSSILIFISLTAITFILPLGIILRTFYPTRKLGGFFIAIAIGLYVIFPLSYLFDALLINSYNSNPITNITALSHSASSFENEMFSSMGATNSTRMGIVSNIESKASELFSSVGSLINILFSTISSLIMQVFILPIFSLVITGISIKEFASLLGSDAFFGKFKVL